jgi:hypothetical protein
MPVVGASGMVYTPLAYYSAGLLKDRLFYLADEKKEPELQGSDAGQRLFCFLFDTSGFSALRRRPRIWRLVVGAISHSRGIFRAGDCYGRDAPPFPREHEDQDGKRGGFMGKFEDSRERIIARETPGRSAGRHVLRQVEDRVDLAECGNRCCLSERQEYA